MDGSILSFLFAGSFAQAQEIAINHSEHKMNEQPYKHFKLVHQLKRRIRIVSPILKNDVERGYIFEILLKKREEIKKVRSVFALGSVVIEFDASRLPKANLLILIDAVLGNLAVSRQQEASQKKKQFDGPLKDVELAVEGMSCASCALLIEMVLNRDARVKTASVNFATETVNVCGLMTQQDVGMKIAGLGYSSMPIDTLSQRKLLVEKEQLRIKQAKKRFIWASLLSAPVVGIAMSMTRSRGALWLQALLSTPVVFGAGQQFFSKAYKLAQQRAANMDTLIAIGVGSAYGYSVPALFLKRGHVYFEAAAAIISFVLLGRYLEERARGQAGQAIRKLIDLQPQQATVIRDGIELKVDVDDVVVDDVLLIRPGEKIPVDGHVIDGISTVDESMITGESMPVVKERDEKVIGGCLNGNGVLTITATAVGMDTVLAGIVHMVDQAQAAKLPIQKTVDQISAVFVPAVMGISALTFVGWLLEGAALSFAFGNAISVLLIACPCALGLATPAAIMVGTGQAANKGIFVRNGESLEVATKLDAIVFDKTGTITEGRPRVSSVHNISRFSDDDLIAAAAAAENNSEHFLARAVVEFAQQKEIALSACDEFISEPGRGVKATVSGKQLLLGNRAWMQENAIVLDELLSVAESLAQQGKTPVFMAVNGSACAIFAIADKPRAEAVSAIARLHQMGVETLMVTGDTRATAEYVASKVNIDQVVADARPDDKLAIIHNMQAEGHRVGMIGDGVNDAPALAAADVGFAIGTGTDIAIESADLTLVHGDIHKVTDSIELSADTIKIIKQNLLWAFGYNTLAIPVAALGRLNPMLASAAMALSSVSVIVNSLRLSRK